MPPSARCSPRTPLIESGAFVLQGATTSGSGRSVFIRRPRGRLVPPVRCRSFQGVPWTAPPSGPRPCRSRTSRGAGRFQGSRSSHRPRSFACFDLFVQHLQPQVRCFAVGAHCGGVLVGVVAVVAHLVAAVVGHGLGAPLASGECCVHVGTIRVCLGMGVDVDRCMHHTVVMSDRRVTPQVGQTSCGAGGGFIGGRSCGRRWLPFACRRCC